MTSADMTSPHLSILMGVFNESLRIRRSIDSILAQTFTEWELIVMDDNSTDATFSILQRYAEQDQRNKVFKNAENIGVFASMNAALVRSVAPLIARMDGDDEMLPNKLKVQMDFMSEHPEIGVLGSGAFFVDSSGAALKTVTFPETHAEIAAVMPYSNPIINPSVVMRRSLLADKFYAEKIRRAGDYELWSRLIKVTQFHNLPTPLIRYLVNDVKPVSTAMWTLYVRLLIAIRLRSPRGVVYAFLGTAKMLATKHGAEVKRKA